MAHLSDESTDLNNLDNLQITNDTSRLNKSDVLRIAKVPDIIAFTDASFCLHDKVAAIGFKLHYESEVHIEILKIGTSVEAELQAILFCLEHVRKNHPDSTVEIFSDCTGSISDIQPYLPPNITVKYIKGHTRPSTRTENDKMMKWVDRHVKSYLRKFLQQQ